MKANKNLEAALSHLNIATPPEERSAHDEAMHEFLLFLEGNVPSFAVLDDVKFHPGSVELQIVWSSTFYGSNGELTLKQEVGIKIYQLDGKPLPSNADSELKSFVRGWEREAATLYRRLEAASNNL